MGLFAIARHLILRSVYFRLLTLLGFCGSACGSEQQAEPADVAMGGLAGALSSAGGATGQQVGGARASEAEGGAPFASSGAPGMAGVSGVDGGATGEGGSALRPTGGAGQPNGAGGASQDGGATSDGGQANEDCEFEYGEAHGDLFVEYADGLSWGIRSAFGRADAETVVAPSRVCVIVPKASYELGRSLGGAPPEWEFLGEDTGEPFWILPQSSRMGMPWLGASTENVPLNVYAADKVTLSIVGLKMPKSANVSAWSQSSFGSEIQVMFSSALEDFEHSFSVGVHVHFNWGFTRSGRYEITFEVSGLRDGTVESSARQALRVLVMP